MAAKSVASGKSAPQIESVRSGERDPGFQFELFEPCTFGECLDMGDEVIGGTLPSGVGSDVDFLQFCELAAQEQRTAPDGATLCPSHEHMAPIGQKRLNRERDLPFGGKLRVHRRVAGPQELLHIRVSGISQFHRDHHVLSLATVGKNDVRRAVRDLLRDGSDKSAAQSGMPVPTDGNRIRPDSIGDSDQRFCDPPGTDEARSARVAFAGRLGQRN
jgi:hypothetical protein